MRQWCLLVKVQDKADEAHDTIGDLSKHAQKKAGEAADKAPEVARSAARQVAPFIVPLLPIIHNAAASLYAYPFTECHPSFIIILRLGIVALFAAGDAT